MTAPSPRLVALRELAAEAELERRDFLYEATEQLRRFQAALRSSTGDARIIANGVWDTYFSEVLRDHGAPGGRAKRGGQAAVCGRGRCGHVQPPLLGPGP